MTVEIFLVDGHFADGYEQRRLACRPDVA